MTAFGATSFFNDTASEMAYWILPAFLTSIGAGPAALGIIEGVAESVTAFAKLGSGYWSDRLAKRKPVVVAGYAVANAVKPLLALVGAWWQVLLIRFADRFAKGVRGAPRDVMVAESAAPERVGAAFGLLQAMDSAGAIAGPLLALAILPAFGFRGVFVAAAVPGLLSILVVSFFVRERNRAKENSTSTQTHPDGATLPKLPASFYYLVGVIAVFSIANSSDMFLVLRAQSVGISVKHAPLLGLVFNLTYTLFSWPAGRLSDALSCASSTSSGLFRSRHTTAAAGYVVFAIVYAVFAWAPSRAAIWGMMAFYGLYYALTAPVLKAIVADSAPAEVRGRAFGIFAFVTSVTTLFASLLTGQLWKHFGAAFPFWVSAGLAFVSAIALVAAPQRRRESVTTKA